MADRNLLQAAGGPAASPVNGYFYVVIAGVDYYISEEDLHAALNSGISGNTSAIAALLARVTALENLTDRKIKTNTAGSSTFTIEQESSVYGASIYYVSGGDPITVKLGTTPGGNDLIYDMEINSTTSKEGSATFRYTSPKTTSGTLYLTVSGGRIDIVLFYSRNIVTI
jgi:hypothetical protein